MFRPTHRKDRPATPRHSHPAQTPDPALTNVSFEPLEPKLLLSTYYIATSGSDSAAGSQSAPFATLDRFFDIAKAGDTVLIRGGTYNGSATGWRNLSPSVSGTASAPITVKSYPGEKVVIDRGSSSGDTFVRLTNGEAYLRFEGFTVKNYLVGFNIYRGSASPHHITLDSLEIANIGVYGSGGDGRGVRMSDGANNITISNTDVHHVGGVGIVGGGDVDYITIDNVTSHDINDGDGAGGDGDGINFTYARGFYPDHITVRNSKTWNTSEDGIDIKADNVLLDGDVAWNATANAFKAWAPFATSQDIARQGKFTVRNCAAWGAGQVAFEAFDIPILDMDNCFFIADGSEPAVMYKRGYGGEPWRGNVSIRNTVMQQMSGRAALAVLNSSNVLFDLEGNTYYSTGSTAVTVYTSDTAQRNFTGSAVENGDLTSAYGVEHDGSADRVNASPEIAYARGPKQLGVGQSGSFTAMAVDPDSSTVSYSWSFGDGTSSVSGASASHSFAANGTYTVTLTARDGSGATSTSPWTVTVGAGGIVTPTNHAPVATDDRAAAQGTTPVLLNLLANDTDSDGDSLTLTSFTQGARGAVARNNNGTITYTPTAPYTGQDSFSYILSDGKGGTDTGAVIITLSQTPVQTGAYTGTDIGSPTLAGSTAYDAATGTYTVAGAGANIWGTADQFRYAYQSMTGDGEIVARVSSMTAPHQFAKAGLMIRDGLSAGAANVMMTLTGINGTGMYYRSAASGTAANMLAGDTAQRAPVWLKLVRQGNTFTGYKSVDGTTWTQTGTVTVAMGATVNVGMAVGSHNTSQLSTARFTNVALNKVTTPTTPTPTLNLQGVDVGSPALEGRIIKGATAGRYTVSGAGVNIWNGADQFQYAFQTMDGNGTIIAKLDSMASPHHFAKAGVMIRQSSATGAAHVMMALTGSEGSGLYYRTVAGGSSANILAGDTALRAPMWVKLVRTGDSFSGYKSADGVNWTLVGTATVEMGATVAVGLAVGSHDVDSFCTANFSNVRIID